VPSTNVVPGVVEINAEVAVNGTRRVIVEEYREGVRVRLLTRNEA
jgi:hypothetical protein